MWPFSRDYDLRFKKLKKLQLALKDSRDIKVDSSVLQELQKLSTSDIMSGHYLFGQDRRKVISIEDIKEIKSIHPSPTKLPIDFSHYLETVEEAEQQKLRYLGICLSRSGTQSNLGVSNSDISTVQHPNHHLENRLYIIGLARESELELYIAKSFTQPKRVRLGKNTILFEGYSYKQKTIDWSNL